MSANTTIVYLNREEIERLGGKQSGLYVTAVARALTLHAAGDYMQPLKPYLRTQKEGYHIADRIIAMPAYLGGEQPVSGIKWIGSKHDNPQLRGLERASGVIILNDPETNFPIAVLEAGLISGMRTAAVSVIGARHLAKPGFTSVSCLGCGAIAAMQLQSMLEQFPHVTRIQLFDLNAASAERLAAQLEATAASLGRAGLRITVCGTAEACVRQGEVVITCTVTDQPYIPFEWLQRGAFVSNISIMDLQKDVFLRADKVLVDDWSQANREKKTLNQLVEEGKFSRERLHAELGEVVAGTRPGRESAEEIIVLNPMGMAIEDIASAHEIYLAALSQGGGTTLDLFSSAALASAAR